MRVHLLLVSDQRREQAKAASYTGGHVVVSCLNVQNLREQHAQNRRIGQSQFITIEASQTGIWEPQIELQISGWFPDVYVKLITKNGCRVFKPKEVHA